MGTLGCCLLAFESLGFGGSTPLRAKKKYSKFTLVHLFAYLFILHRFLSFHDFSESDNLVEYKQL